MKLPELHSPLNVLKDNRNFFLETSIVICGIILFLAVVLLLALKPAVLFGIVSVVAISRVLYVVLKGK